LLIFLDQPINNVNNGVMQQKVVNNQAFKVVKGKRFTYYIKTDENGIVKEVGARIINKLSPCILLYTKFRKLRQEAAF
jgi:hypothetical protein